MTASKIVPWFILTFVLSVVTAVVIDICFFKEIDVNWTTEIPVDNYYIGEDLDSAEYVYNEDEAITAITIPVQNGTFYITKNTINPDILTISAPSNTTFTLVVGEDIQEYTTKNNESNIYTTPLNKGEVKVITETETLTINEVITLGE